MKSRWKSLREPDAGTDYLVMASSIPPRSLRSTWRLFQGSRAVRKQLLSTEGVIGFSMLAEPLRRHYATLSIWDDAEALAAFTAGRPHHDLMVELAPEMAPTTFVTWTISGRDPRPTWSEALERLERANPATHDDDPG